MSIDKWSMSSLVGALRIDLFNENRVMLLLTFFVWMCRLDSASDSLFLEEDPAAGGNYSHRKVET
jgi:hypothetical protein